jgi:hypothetical protein
MAPTTLPRPVYAFAGAGDLAADQLKKLAAQATEMQARAAELPQELKKLVDEFPADLQKLAATLPADLQKFATDLPSIAAQLQAKAREIDVADVTAAVKKNVETAQHKAVDVYGVLVERGQKVVAKRDGAATKDAKPSAEKKAPAKKAVAKKAPAKAVESKSTETN